MNRFFIYLLFFFSALVCSLTAKAQDTADTPEYVEESESIYELYERTELPEAQPLNFWGKVKEAFSPVGQWCMENGVANHLDAGVSVSSMGLGLELKTPVTKWADLRVGVDWVPKFTVPLSFNLNTYSDGLPTGSFNKIAATLYDITGLELDETVNMKGTGSMVNFKFIVDVYPVPANRHWHVSAGFFAGTSMVAKAYNAYNEKPTLVGLNIYNRAYEYFTNLKSIFDVPLGGGVYMDPDLVEKIQDKFRAYGRMGIRIGNFLDGTPYIMEPAPDGSISARAYVNHFKPYLGAGYSTDLDAAKRWHLAVDLGMIIWGGVPDVMHYDYNLNRNINFTKDLKNIRGKVGDYVKVFKAFPVYPLVSVSFSYSIL